MSTGEAVKPTPSQPVRTGLTWSSRIASLVIAGLLASQQAGLISPQHAATIKTVTDQITPIADKIETAINDKKMDTSIIVDLVNEVKKLTDRLPKPEPTPIDAVIPKPAPDQKRIADMEEQIKKLLDELAKKHEPKPPEPVPPPQTTDLKIVDAAGKPITGGVASGQSVKVTASSAGDWKYLVTSGDGSGVSVFTYPDHCIVTLSGGAAVALSHASPTSHSMILVRCQDAPRPPPKPVDPVEPDDKPKLGMRVLMLYESSQNHSAKQDLILNSFTTGKISDAVAAKVTKDADGRPNWRRWDVDLNVDTTSVMGKLFAETKSKAVSRGLPSLIVAMGDDATIFQIPKDVTEDQVLAVIEGAK